MFVKEFGTTKMTCLVEQILEDGEWAILEWKDPLGSERMWLLSGGG